MVTDRPDIAAAGLVVTGAAGIAADPAASDWVVMFVCSVAGGYASVAFREEALSVWKSVRTIVACVCVALPCAWIAATLLHAKFQHLPMNPLAGTVSCVLAFIADQTPSLKRVLLNRFTRKVS